VKFIKRTIYVDENRMRIWSQLTASFVVSFIFIWCGTHVHDFILADNRHYVFYIWSRILRHDTIRLLVLPAIVAIGWVFADWRFDGFTIVQKGRHDNKWRHVIITVFWICSAIALVPAGLLELRYFQISSSLFVVFQSRLGTNVGLTKGKGSKSNLLQYLLQYEDVICIILNCFLNFVILWVFIMRPFNAQNGTISRFMF